jgi:hypothetical protein
MLAAMISPTLNAERRQTPRTTVNRLACINLDSNDGAIVLNVSEGGLCFHSFVPIQWSDTIHFWFSEHKHRIEADGKLAWMDETQKKGGLQFTNLSAEARLQIRDWMTQAATPAPANAKSAASLSSPPDLPAPNEKHPDRSAVLKSSPPVELPSPITKAPALLKGFSAGLVLGILVSTLVVAAFLLHSYRREFGNSLIRLGERLGAKSQAQAVPQASVAAPPGLAPNPSPVNLPKQPLIEPPKPQSVKFETPLQAALTRAIKIPAGTADATPGVSPKPEPTALPKTAAEPAGTDNSRKVESAPKLEPPIRPIEHVDEPRAVESGPYSAMFLEIGKFHDLARSDRATGQLKHLGYPAIVIHKSHLWMNSYQVLAGPFTSDGEVKSAHKDLTSRGFRPRAYERGSHEITFPAGLTIHGSHVPLGNCVVSWEAYATDANVKIEKEGSLVASVDGKLVRRDDTYERDAIVYQKNRDGSRTLLEIRFGGMSKVLVFGKSF